MLRFASFFVEKEGHFLEFLFSPMIKSHSNFFDICIVSLDRPKKAVLRTWQVLTFQRFVIGNRPQGINFERNYAKYIRLWNKTYNFDFFHKRAHIRESYKRARRVGRVNKSLRS